MRRSVIALSLVVAASAAFAEPPIGSRLGDRTRSNPVENQRDSAQIAHQLAGCIVAKRGSAGRDLLDSRNQEEVEKLNAKMDGELDCIANISRNALVEGVQVFYPPQVIRGDLAEVFLKRSRQEVARLQPLPIQKVYSRSWFAFTGRHVSVDEMAACVADTNPGAIMALVDSPPFSDDENAAFGKLVPFMGPCLQAGTKVDAKREPLRAAMAEALYQRMTNPAESVVAPTEGSTAAAQK
jgi:hypothetical protein